MKRAEANCLIMGRPLSVLEPIAEVVEPVKAVKKAPKKAAKKK